MKRTTPNSPSELIQNSIKLVRTESMPKCTPNRGSRAADKRESPLDPHRRGHPDRPPANAIIFPGGRPEAVGVELNVRLHIGSEPPMYASRSVSKSCSSQADGGAELRARFGPEAHAQRCRVEPEPRTITVSCLTTVFVRGTSRRYTGNRPRTARRMESRDQQGARARLL